MKWKPEETDIIDYLYGSMTNEMKLKFETYLKENPAMQKELNDLRQTQNILPSFQDEEVIPPVPLVGTSSAKSGPGKNWLYPVSIAASIAVILITGYFTNFRMSFNDSGFEIGFINTEQLDKGLSQDEVEKMIASQLNQYSNQVDGRLTNMSTALEEGLLANRQETDDKFAKLTSNSTTAQLDEAQVLQFIAQLQDENSKMMQNFLQASNEEQRTYLRNILLEYSQFIENQRQEDIQYLQASLRDIRSDSELKQEATDQILANIISTVNNQTLPVNDRHSLE